MHTIDGPTAPLPPRTPAHQKPTGLWLATSLWRAARAWPLLAGVLCVGVLPPAFAQAIDPPGRVARLNLVEGAVSFAPADAAGGAGWTPAVRNRPLT
ncbi:MAG: hypothetical protein LH479_06295 [Polaromonas sp.]|nr:hypothetical protein [Polaromonas sp.]